MGTVWVVGAVADQCRRCALALRAFGFDCAEAEIDSLAGLGEDDAVVLVEGPGLRLARRLREMYRPAGMPDGVVAWTDGLTLADVARLDALGIRFQRNRGGGVDALTRLIGEARPDLHRAAREQATRAKAVAADLFDTTLATLGTFAAGAAFDPAYHAELARTCTARIRDSNLFLLFNALRGQQASTAQHCALVTIFATAFALRLGFPAPDLERVFRAAFFHDIGKSAVPAAIIDKPDRLTADEMQVMRTHVTEGHRLLRRFPETAGEVAFVALHHHEYLDGSGYPHGLGAADIPDLVRLITIADVFAALTEPRAYKPSIPAMEAFAILRGMGGKLDQDLVSEFLPIARTLAGER